uniref:Sulfhydryl oxidase n=1 Tax=Chrysemys picta bellii TaxID=8478 RepID=A0A8C3IPI4_CHRPI
MLGVLTAQHLALPQALPPLHSFPPPLLNLSLSPPPRMAGRRCHPHALLLLLLAATLAGAPPGGLYSPGDPLVLLQVDTLESSVLNSSSAWLVEFYASWCGHCVHFAPTWRALAADIQGDWDRVGMGHCYLGYRPWLFVHGALVVSSVCFVPPTDPGDSIQNLRQSIITNLEMHKESWPPACPPLEPARLLEGDIIAECVCVHVCVLRGPGVTLDMLQYENIAVRRVLSSEEELVKKYGVTAFPSSFLLINNGTFSRIPARSFYTHFLRRLPGVTRGRLSRLLTPCFSPPLSSSNVYMADLESALHYALRVEVARFSVLTGERVRALKDFVAVLAKYFPGRPFVRNFLHSVDRWLRNVRESRIPYSALELVLTNRKEVGLLSNNVTWVGCQGSEPHFRGYPCSLWTLFHLLTVQATRHRRLGTGPLEVLGAMRGYIQSFFGCRECAQHFEGMAAESMDKVRSVDEAALWLWSRHNRVNARLAGTETEDPQFPKLQWPPPELCRPCHSVVKRRQVWDEAAVLQFLKAYFSPINIFLNYTEQRRELESGPWGRRLSKRDTIPLLLADDSHQAFDYAAVWERLRRRGLGSKQLIGALEEDEGDTLRRSHWFRMLGVGFSRLDVSLCIILYFLSSMCLLGMYTFFRMRTRHRKGRPSFPTA